MGDLADALLGDFLDVFVTFDGIRSDFEDLTAKASLLWWGNDR